MTDHASIRRFWLWFLPRHRREHRLLPEEFDSAEDPEIAPILLDHERRTQRATAVLRLIIGPVLVAIASAGIADGPSADFTLLIHASAAYMAVALLSLIVSGRRLFRPFWAPVFIVLDVIWYEYVIYASLIIYDLPMTAFAAMPTATLIFFFLALAGMRFSPSALLAGLGAFIVIDGGILILIALDRWPLPFLDPRPYFGPAATAFRLGIVCAVGVVTAITAWRSRRVLVHALLQARQRERARRLVGHFVPEALTDSLMESGGVLAPANREASILYTDIAGFTGIVERLPPKTVIAMLDAYFAAVEGAIVEAGGAVTQFQGDAVLAVFNVPIERPDHAARAVAAARRIAAITSSERFAGERLPTRIGVNTGSVVAGTVNGVERVGYTVHGDAVNLAARLEAMNKELGTRLLVSASTVAALGAGEAAALTPVGRVEVRGRKEPVEVYSFAEDGGGNAGGRGSSAAPHPSTGSG